MDAMTCIRNCFGVIPDCRGKAHLLHPLDEILTVSLLAEVSGAHSYRAYEMWATCHLGWLRRMGLELPNGVPSGLRLSRLRLGCPTRSRACSGWSIPGSSTAA